MGRLSDCENLVNCLGPADGRVRYILFSGKQHPGSFVREPGRQLWEAYALQTVPGPI